MSEDVTTLASQNRGAIAFRGLLGILIGVVIVLRPLQSVATLATLLALWALFEGVAAIVFGIGLRSRASHWWLVVAGGVVSIAIGILDLAYAPGLTLRLIIVLTGWWLLISGVLGIYAAFKERKAGASWGWNLAWSVVALLAGLSMFASPNLSLLSLMRVLAVFGIAGGIFRLAVALESRSATGHARPVARHPLRM